jgi:hypothetical protein
MTEPERELLTKKAVDTFMDRWINDPSFARQLKADPKAALTSCRIEPWDHLVNSLEDVDKNTPAEELRKRISKGTTLN